MLSILLPRRTSLFMVVFWFLIGLPFLWVQGGYVMTAGFWMTSLLFWFWYRHLVKRDRKLGAARRSR